MSFEFRFKGVIRARLSDVSGEVIPEEGGLIRKSAAAPSGALNFESIMHKLEYMVL